MFKYFKSRARSFKWLTIVQVFACVAAGAVFLTIRYYTAITIDNPVATFDRFEGRERKESTHTESVSSFRHSDNSVVFRSIRADSFTYPIGNATLWKLKCSRLSLLVYVHSSTVNANKRAAIRTTWASEVAKKRLNMDVVFVTGLAKTPAINSALRDENNRYGDLIQADFIDTYANLSMKSLSAINWVRKNCGTVRRILKTDDDIYVNIAKLGDFLDVRLPKIYFNTDNVIICNVYLNSSPYRSEKDKWYISKNDYKYEFYPNFCQGAAYLLTQQSLHTLYSASFGQEFFKYDDVFLTGIIAQKAGIAYFSISEMYLAFSEYSHPGKVIFSIQSDTEIINLWQKGIGKP